MSGIAGIFNRNAEPVNPDLLERMTSIVSYRGPDGIGSWLDGPFGVSQLLLSTTSESVEEHSPILDGASGLCIAFDGRVDNREELLSALESHGLRCRTATDMELVLKSYELWGVSCPEKILGDFAFAVWDQKKQQLYCARDIKGFRPFYYSLADSHFLFGSEIRQFFQHPAVSDQVNAGMAAEYLTGKIQNFDETLYSDIMRLPPAHYLRVDQEHFHIQQYWQPDLDSTIRYSRDSDYVEHYLELLRDAVACRLRCSGKVGATMSGGLDSTSIVGMAQTLYADQGGRESIRTFSITFPGRECDEFQEIGEMIKMWDLDAFIYPFTTFARDPGWRDQVRISREPPDSPLVTVSEPLLDAARSRQVTVMLSGLGADGILGGSEYPYLQALKKLKVPFMVEHFRHQWSENGGKYALSRLFRSLAWPLFPPPLRRFLLSLRPGKFQPGLLQSEFLAAVAFEGRLANNRNAWQFRDLAKWQTHSALFDVVQLFFLESEERAYAKFGIEQRHPFCDRRLLEFAIAVPDFEKMKYSQHKHLILKGSNKLIPANLQKSINYGHFANSFQEMLKLAFIPTLLESMELSRIEWVSLKKVEEMYWKFMNNSDESLEIHGKDHRWVLSLILVCSMEVWAREAQIDLP